LRAVAWKLQLVRSNVLGARTTAAGLLATKSSSSRRPTTGVLGPISRPKRGTNTETPSTNAPAWPGKSLQCTHAQRFACLEPHR
jgi:5-methylcytosine-specific restriction endonuclease McrA